MNWSAIAAVVSIVTLVVLVFGIVYAGGKMAQRIDDNVNDLRDHKLRLDGHDIRHISHEVEIAKLVEWKNGYNAAAAVSGNPERRS
jgi:hypothetical protein